MTQEEEDGVHIGCEQHEFDPFSNKISLFHYRCYICSMSDLEAQVGAILEIMVHAAVTEMHKVIGGSASTPPSPCAGENTRESSEKVKRV